MTPYIISGLVVGSIYAISALGLVLTYTSSRVFNFAHGALAYGIAVFYYYLTRQNGWSIATAAPFTILVVAPLLGLAALRPAVPAADARHADGAARVDGRALGRDPGPDPHPLPGRVDRDLQPPGARVQPPPTRTSSRSSAAT